MKELEKGSVPDRHLTVGSLNIRGQMTLGHSRILQLEDFVKQYKIDVLNLQETDLKEDVFLENDFLALNYQLIINNNPKGFGTSVLIKNDLEYDNVKMDTGGRLICYDLTDLNITGSNIYLQCGVLKEHRDSRDLYCSKIIPEIFHNRKHANFITGDWNNIVNRMETTRNAENKISNVTQKMLSTFSLVDSYRQIFPKDDKTMSHYYQHPSPGASRLDRIYHSNLETASIGYIPTSLSDHMALVCSYHVPEGKDIRSPKIKPYQKICEEVAKDKVFNIRLKHCVEGIMSARENKDPQITWEKMIKPSIKKLARQRTKELKEEKRGRLNVLNHLQGRATAKLHAGDMEALNELKIVQNEIKNFYENEAKKISIAAKSHDLENGEKTRIYHHQLLKTRVKKTYISKLQTEEGLILGQDECHRFLEKDVKNLLTNVHVEDEESSTELLNEIQSSITAEDNEILLKNPDINEIKKVIKDSNLHSSPGFDGIPVCLYDACWNSLSAPFLNMVKEIHDGGYPSTSQNISILIYGSKAGKEKSINPSDKRRISLLNSDFKILTGIEARRLKAVASHLLDDDQLVATTDSRLHHGINKVRDAITVLGKRGAGGAIADFDFTAAFDNLCLNFCFKVMKKKGISQIFVDRLKRLYKNGVTRVCVNDKVGDPIQNIYQSLRQGDITSMLLFVLSMEPLLKSLKRMLKGIVISKVRVQGPLPKGMKKPLYLEEVYKIIGYADDLKIAIRSLEDLIMAVRQCTKMEMASGVKLHRSTTKGKCRLLTVGTWRESLTQNDIPFDFIKLTDNLNLLGVSLCATYRLTREKNAEIII